jgi:hypothetical protein
LRWPLSLLDQGHQRSIFSVRRASNFFFFCIACGEALFAALYASPWRTLLEVGDSSVLPTAMSPIHSVLQRCFTWMDKPRAW